MNGKSVMTNGTTGNTQVLYFVAEWLDFIRVILRLFHILILSTNKLHSEISKVGHDSELKNYKIYDQN